MKRRRVGAVYVELTNKQKALIAKVAAGHPVSFYVLHAALLCAERGLRVAPVAAWACPRHPNGRARIRSHAGIQTAICAERMSARNRSGQLRERECQMALDPSRRRP